MTVAQAAAALGVPIRTIRYWLEIDFVRGERLTARFWLVPESEVERVRGQRPPRGPEPKGKSRRPPANRVVREADHA